MRLHLDTNILVFLICDNTSLSRDVLECIFDYSSTLYTSVVCVHELIHLFQIGKISARNENGKTLRPEDIIDTLESMSIRRVPVNDKHLQTFSTLPFIRDHRDPFDRMIIAQAISDKATLVSSDLKFQWYSKYGLHTILNER